MTSITTRAGKGSPLTHNEVDANFTNLNNDKLDTAGIALGSAASPTLKFTGDPNTGIYSPGADQLAVSTGGTGRLFVDASGNIGIGTGPINIAGFKRIDIGEAGVSGGLLTLRSSGGAQEANISCSAAGLAFTTNSYATLFDARASEIIFGTGSSGTERLRIDSSGRVGIGTAGAGVKLEVFGASNANEIRSSDGTIIGQWYQDTNGYGVFGTVSNHPQVFRTNSAERLRIDSAGNVGIGTTSPVAALHVVSASAGANSARFSDGVNSTLLIGHAATNLTYLDAFNNLGFYISGTERARIDSSGRVGIGTTSPTTLLDVNADTVRVRTARTPASASATGATGEICWDANYIYVCTATNTWKRSAISTW